MYDAGFFETIREGCRASANAVAPIVHAAVDHPKRVVDVGCGEGWWARAFEQLGCEATGIDGPGTQSILERFIPHDLGQPLPTLAAGFDLAVSLEVAEHLPPDRAAGFVAEICALAPVVLFSAAIPGQGGTGHVNEQWPAYWVELFSRCGFAVSGALRWRIWDDDRIENWYRQNLLVATQYPGRFPDLFNAPTSEPWPVVHPVLYNARRA